MAERTKQPVSSDIAAKIMSLASGVAAALLAWLVPGAGHVFLGRTVRGVILFLAIGATFWAGVAVGGVMTVDSRYDRWWFYAQSLTGVHGLVGWYRQDRVYEDILSKVGDAEAPSGQDGRPTKQQMQIDTEMKKERIVLASPGEGVARAYSGIAGMLNLLCIFDAFMLALMGRSRRDKAELSQPSAEGVKT